ncbi:MAG: 1-hydroxycarotenoid 3,4-desaturase CrtD [Chitinophagaceae bacterium]
MSHPSPTVQKAIIIGSGVAGLASAIRLAVKGYEVVVYERNKYPGGKLSSFLRDGYVFDAGPSLFTQPENVAELFELAGKPMDDYFKYSRVPVSCHYFYENGKTIAAPANRDEFAKAMQAQFGESPEAVHNYLSAAEKLYNDIGTVFLNHSLHKRGTFFKKYILRALAATKPSYIFSSLHRFNRQQFKTEEAVQLFNRYATYNGSNPYQAPAMLSLIPHLEINGGTYYPKGGMISIINALYQLALNQGVQFHFNTPVESIIEHEGKVCGIVAGGENIFSNIVVSNADVYFTYKHLLHNEPKAKKLLQQERSSSAFIFYWGINQSFPQLGLHNILFSADYKKEFEHLFGSKTIYEDPTVYINITSKMEEGHAPEGKENWFVMINAPANTGQDWDAIQLQLRRWVIEKINRILQTAIEPMIETESVMNPVDIEAKTASYMGSLYGTSSNSRLAAFFRHPNFTHRIKNLYFVGGSVHPGGGIPLCLKSAKIMSGLVS